eukprot:TRINITY_DN21549_c0_g1_i1.p1 TRINITY_DN21549_c0_g1~~TRINITY_DN21549_c0_g1_i1.p1  ORF type:complete len:506 (+),score=211.66 TRINITY_DN21549_c0_g1_i1:78-1520(+)
MALTQELAAAGLRIARRCCDFINAGPSPFHVVANCQRMLVEKGFQQLHEKNAWKIQRNGKYFVVRAHGSIVAFAVGGSADSCSGFKILGAHTDSPCLQAKPLGGFASVGYQQLSVQTYGGGLWHTWFDRDLAVAGRVVLRGSTEGSLQTRLVRIPEPVLRIPNIAIHLTTAAERDGFKFNKETQLAPLLCSEAAAQLSAGPSADAAAEGEPAAKKPRKEDKVERTNPELLRRIADSCGAKPEDILDCDLYLADAQPAAVGGLLQEYVFAPRIDNLISCLTSMDAILAHDTTADSQIAMIGLFDHEECGSASTAGAYGTMLGDAMKRINTELSTAGEDNFTVACARSFLLSVDGSHAVHPNYSDKHMAKLRPQMNKGPVLKFNSNQHYATTAVTAAVVRQCAELAGVPLQEFAGRNDIPCGGTIGRLMSTRYGIRTADVGNAMLSMHSIREQCGTVDLEYLSRLSCSFFTNFAKVDTSDAD